MPSQVITVTRRKSGVDKLNDLLRRFDGGLLAAYYICSCVYKGECRGWKWLLYSVYNPRIAEKVAHGYCEEPCEEALELVKMLDPKLERPGYWLKLLATLHYLSHFVYPPVDPVEYTIAHGYPSKDVEKAWRLLVDLNLV